MWHTLIIFINLILTTPAPFSLCITKVTEHFVYPEFASKDSMQAKYIKASAVHSLSKVILIFKDRVFARSETVTE